MTRRPSLRRWLSTALFIGAASAALSAAGPDALVPFKDAAGAATEVGVAFVIDFGGSTKPLVGCVRVPPADNGYYALAAFLQQEGEAQPVYNSSGLLCSINGIPAAPACGQSVPGGYQFWSYWTMTNGSGAWSYADRGASVPVGSAADGEDVEGWRFQNPGPDNPSAPAPRVVPDYTAICGSPTPVSTPPAGPPVVAATVPPTTDPGSTTAPAGTEPPSSSPAPAVTSATPVSGREQTSGSAAAAKGATGRTSGARSTAGSESTATTSRTSSSKTSPTSGKQAQALRASATDDRQGSGGSAGSAAPVIIGAVLVAALIAVAAYRWRRRPGTP
jgi:hypothetical protein